MAKFELINDCKDCNCRSTIFRQLHDPELELLNSNRYEVSFKAGEIMFKQGTPFPSLPLPHNRARQNLHRGIWKKPDPWVGKTG